MLFDIGAIKGRGSSILVGRWISVTVVWNEGALAEYFDGPAIRIGFGLEQPAGDAA